ncbi:MAG: hypothetical protein U0572_02805 [Phycisphaerales bacterium]
MTQAPAAPAVPASTGSPAKPAGTESLLGRLMSLRPAYRWAIIAVIALGIYSFADEYPWAKAREFDQDSAKLERILDDAALRVGSVKNSEEIKAAVNTFGRIRIPREERDGTQALSKSIDRVMKESASKFNTIVKYSLDVRSAGKFQSGAFPGIAQPGERVEKVVGELKFDASQDVAAMILRDLEASEDIESVSRVKLTKKSESEKKLAVQLTVEAWVRVAEPRR